MSRRVFRSTAGAIKKAAPFRQPRREKRERRDSSEGRVAASVIIDYLHGLWIVESRPVTPRLWSWIARNSPQDRYHRLLADLVTKAQRPLLSPPPQHRQHNPAPTEGRFVKRAPRARIIYGKSASGGGITKRALICGQGTPEFSSRSRVRGAREVRGRLHIRLPCSICCC
jgi:hypothetical protein